MPRKKSKQKVESIVSSSEDEWEEVAETNEKDTNDNDVQIRLDLPDAITTKHSSKAEQAKEWILTLIKRAINKSAKEIQVRMHKTHLLSLLCVGMQLNRVCLDEELRCLAFSMIDSATLKLAAKCQDKVLLEKLISNLGKKFSVAAPFGSGMTKLVCARRHDDLKRVFETASAKTYLDLVMVFVLTLRTLGFNCRLVMSFQPIPLKALTEKQKQARTKKVELALEKAKAKIKKPAEITIPQLDGAADDALVSRKTTRSRRSIIDSTTKLKNKRDSLDSNKENDSSKQKKSTKIEAKHKKVTKRTKSETVSKYVFSADEGSQSQSDDDAPPAKKIGAMVKQKTKRPRRRKTSEEKWLDRLETDVGLLNSDHVPKKRKSSKATTSKSSKKQTDDTASQQTSSKSTESLKPEKKKSTKAKNSDNDQTEEKSNRRSRIKRKNYAEKSDDDFESANDGSDADFDFDRVVFGNKDIKPKNAKKPRKSTNASAAIKASQPSKASQAVNHWIEVYVEKVGWVVVDCIVGSTVQPKTMELNASKPLHYVVAFDNDECIKDVTARYASDWLITTRKLRVTFVDQHWWKETLRPFKTSNEDLDFEENEELELGLLSQPLPTSISAYKNHPLFALRRHILKYEAVYPPDVPTLGFVRGEEVLPRSSVRVLHTREKWLQSALSVKGGETPYKMVASYLLNKKLNRDSDAPSLALFGKWQTEPYEPPVAKNGKVPRNEYGNVDLFQPSMLPIGCVQLRLPSLNLVARKLNIDIATAIVGFDTHHGYPHPTTDGYVVCKEHEKILKEAWEEEQAHAEEKARQKVEKRVYSHWKIFIRGLLALEKVRKKYSDKADDQTTSSAASNEIESTTAWQAEKLREAKKSFEKKGRRRKK